jgi:hypothetical protein
MIEYVILKSDLIRQMPEKVKNSSCNCDRQEWIMAKMVDEFKKTLVKFSQKNGFPKEIKLIK